MHSSPAAHVYNTRASLILQIDVVNCNIDGRVYVRKSIEKRFALKTREVCPTSFRTPTPNQPFPAMQPPARTGDPSSCSSHWLRLGSSSPVRLPNRRAPQPCHGLRRGRYSLGRPRVKPPREYLRRRLALVAPTGHQFRRVVPLTGLCTSARHHCSLLLAASALRVACSDVKPHNFVITRTAHIQLIDFGSAAPLVPGSRLVPPEYCRVPCGTCDYISPEILQAHEAALVAMELSDEEGDRREEHAGEGGYGAETDWWSTGAMIYEMVFGVAPFFARDIRSTYLKIVDFKKSLAFPTNTSVSIELCDLLMQYVRNRFNDL